jgi:hypothetical protein
MVLRMIVKNVKDWVYARVKPEISRWIQDVHRNRHQICSLTPSGDLVTQRRRDTSRGLSNEIVDFEKSVSPILRSRYRTPRKRTRSTLPHGKTAPEPFERRLAKASVPKVRLNGLSEPVGDDIDDSSDEGYASIHTRSGEESEDDKEKYSSAFVCNDESSEDESDVSYVLSSSEDESTESESVDEENGDGGANSGEDLSGREENDDEYDLSDSESHRHWLNQQLRVVSR